MLELHQFQSNFGLPNPSPFCMKVEAYLRLAGIEYQTQLVTDPGKGPNGKAPWIVDDGKTLPDSRLIIEHLNRKHGYPLKGNLSDEQLAHHHTLGRMLEESTYWVIVYERWIVPENALTIRDAFFGSLPGPMRKLIFMVAQRGVKRALFGQGTGRLSRDEINHIGMKDIDALALILGDQAYFGGEKAAEIDAITMSYVAACIKSPVSSKVCDHLKTKANLVAYYERMMKEVFPDFTA